MSGVSSVTFTFISYRRTAAVVPGDLASTVYYSGRSTSPTGRPAGRSWRRRAFRKK